MKGNRRVKKNGQAVIHFMPSPWATLMHLLLLAGVFALFMGRKPGAFRSADILELVPGFYSHISNFSISYVLLAGVGYLWLMMGVSVRHIALAALIMIAGNVIYELFLPLLNTRDPVDAAYGVAGTLLAFAWLWVIKRVGLMTIPDLGK
ncbi:hypothetical protein [Thermomonas sp.]|uniref:hypothetical protein n=1 Tax=Thermomonas sp. TaxID=1971895 RepID=UPI002488E653|nr:hypothetical protein [Thermomonas sp.]MDI1253014.1 hypothetical protein [Thermomonas sp.]